MAWQPLTCGYSYSLGTSETPACHQCVLNNLSPHSAASSIPLCCHRIKISRRYRCKFHHHLVIEKFPIVNALAMQTLCCCTALLATGSTILGILLCGRAIEMGNLITCLLLISLISLLHLRLHDQINRKSEAAALDACWVEKNTPRSAHGKENRLFPGDSGNRAWAFSQHVICFDFLSI